MQAGRTVLVGREYESAALAHVLDAVRAGLSGVIVVRGEAGIGKTALLDDAATAAGDLDVVRVVGIESEMTLGFAALHQVLSRFVSGIDELPGPQARALRAVFGAVDDVAPDRFLIGLAALTLLSNAAVQRGIVILVDDAQWLDEESAHVLGFVARRLYADRIGLLIARRETADVAVAFSSFPTIRVDALSGDRADELLQRNVDGAFADPVRHRIVNDAGGSPLALLELARELSPDQRAGIEPLPTPYRVNPDLQARFLRQIRMLPPETQTLLLVAAADPTGDPDLVRDAARQLGCDAEASEPAEADGLLRVGARVEFRHSLVRSAIYQGVSEQERRRAHEALAAVTDAEREPDRRAWHRAAATIEPDENVAGELERAASRAQAFGSYAAFAALLARAAELTPDPGRRAGRYLGATVAAVTGGKGQQARDYLALAFPYLVDPLLLAQARRLEATIDFIDSSDAGDRDAGDGRRASASIMLEAATTLKPLDLRLARDTLLDALPMAVFAGVYSSVSPGDLARAAQSMRLPDAVDASAVDGLLDALADLFADGYAAAVPGLRTALAALLDDPRARQEPGRLMFGTYAAYALSDVESVRLLARECVALGRELDAWHVVAVALSDLGLCEIRAGSLAAADQFYAEFVELESLLGNDAELLKVYGLVVTAWRGQESDARAAADAVGRDGRQRGSGFTVSLCDHAVALLELGLGNYREASLLAPESLDDDPGWAPMRAVDAVEAHVRGGVRDGAEGFAGWLTRRSEATQHPFDCGLSARARALTGDDSEAEAHFVESVAQLQTANAALQLARTQLLYGEWLRRQNRRRDARVQLVAAQETFASMGAAAFEQRTRTELLATGARARKRTDDTRRDLTPQEEQIARLAAQGATNPEIGARLFISPSTVDYHLRKVYAKLEISSRRQLIHTQYAEAEASP